MPMQIVGECFLKGEVKGVIMNASDYSHTIHCKVLSQRARIAMRNRKLKESESLYQSSLLEAKALENNQLLLARLNWKLGRLAAFQKQFTTAEHYWLKSLDYAEAINKKNSFFTLRLYAHLGWNCLQQQQYSAAQIWCGRALDAYPKIQLMNKKSRLVSPLRLLLRLCWSQNQNEDALKAHKFIGGISKRNLIDQHLQVV